ncbi:hypothetical protein GTS_26360 [Gandjariella thermophila]|uniref:Uncharacterized protein n=1 Tax=Gandjariella thermophila TaxID=1931992 RepID=A0A4D4JAZ8_9PSEU|nr:hypothetical protein GTS_26360 [Gandjariella thermophila]
MPHRNAPLSLEGRRRLVERCRTRPIAHVAAEMGISRQCASKWINRYRKFGELGLADHSYTPRRQPTATDAETLARIERWRRERKWSAAWISCELAAEGVQINRRTVTRHLARLGLNRRRFLDPTGASNRVPPALGAKPAVQATPTCDRDSRRLALRAAVSNRGRGRARAGRRRPDEPDRPGIGGVRAGAATGFRTAHVPARAAATGPAPSATTTVHYGDDFDDEIRWLALVADTFSAKPARDTA